MKHEGKLVDFLQSMREAVTNWRKTLTIIYLLLAIFILNGGITIEDCSGKGLSLLMLIAVITTFLFFVKQILNEKMDWLALGGFFAGTSIAVIVYLFVHDMLFQFTMEGLITTWAWYVGINLALGIFADMIHSANWKRS